ncbi:hypothetical protein IQ250_15790 [Pseudanabaenaceae cyanobacterium LEGE 13415]|nr:hypothetical protein [Pseudanabaenaceae cyanobacterium LEGE 13415]
MLNPIQQHCPALYASLQEAIAFPDATSLKQLWTEFDAATVDLNDEVLLQVAGEMIDQVADIFVLKTDRVAQRVMSRSRHNEPIVPIDFFDRFVRTTMHIDFDQFIEPIPLLDLSHLNGIDPQRDANTQVCAVCLRGASHPGSEDRDSDIAAAVVREVPIAVLVEWIELLQGLTEDAIDLELSDTVSTDAMPALAYEENVEAWSAQLSQHVASCPQERMSFSALVEALNLPPDAVWLALLLGDHPYELRRKHDNFYSESGIEIVRKDAQDAAESC